MARFDTGEGRDQAALEQLVLTEDSIATVLRFQGMTAEIRGARAEDEARGTYVLRPAGQDQIMDSGTWDVRRRPEEG